MVKVTITLIALCLGASHSLAQSGGAQDYRSLPANILTSRSFGVRQNTDGSVCFPAPWYDNCIYDSNPYSLDLYRIWGLYTLWNGVRDNDRPQSTPLSQATQPPAPPSPPAPVTPVIYEYDWPKQENAPAAFSIVTTGGTEYFATMVWVQEGAIHFNSVDGSIRELPLSSISRPLTQTANARKKLSLHLP